MGQFVKERVQEIVIFSVVFYSPSRRTVRKSLGTELVSRDSCVYFVSHSTPTKRPPSGLTLHTKKPWLAAAKWAVSRDSEAERIKLRGNVSVGQAL